MSRQLKSGEVVEKCAECKWEYPDVGYLSQMFITVEGKGGYTAEICGICALAIGNAQMGTNRKRFSGEMAEQYRVDAIEWRRTHPELRPK